MITDIFQGDFFSIKKDLRSSGMTSKNARIPDRLCIWGDLNDTSMRLFVETKDINVLVGSQILKPDNKTKVHE